MKEYSTSTPKVDFPEKAKGALKFVDDIQMDGMLFAKSYRSTVASGKIKKINLPKLPSTTEMNCTLNRSLFPPVTLFRE